MTQLVLTGGIVLLRYDVVKNGVKIEEKQVQAPVPLLDQHGERTNLEDELRLAAEDVYAKWGSALAEAADDGARAKRASHPPPPTEEEGGLPRDHELAGRNGPLG